MTKETQEQTITCFGTQSSTRALWKAYFSEVHVSLNPA